MMLLSAEQIHDIVDRVAAILIARQSAMYQLSVAELAKGLPVQSYLLYGALSIDQVHPIFLKQLAQKSAQCRAAETLFEAISYGLSISICVADDYLSQLPVCDLAYLPVNWVTPSGSTVHLCPQSIVDYSTVFNVKSGFLILKPKAIVTALARDLLYQRQVTSLHTENGSCN